MLGWRPRGPPHTRGCTRCRSNPRRRGLDRKALPRGRRATSIGPMAGPVSPDGERKSYVLRGVEVTLEGQTRRPGMVPCSWRGGTHDHRCSSSTRSSLPTRSSGTGPPVRPQPAKPDEVIAYERFAARVHELPAGQGVTVTGPLKKSDTGYLLEVRTFTVVRRIWGRPSSASAPTIDRRKR